MWQILFLKKHVPHIAMTVLTTVVIIAFLSESKMDLQISHEPQHTVTGRHGASTCIPTPLFYSLLASIFAHPLYIYIFNCFNKVNHFPTIIQHL